MSLINRVRNTPGVPKSDRDIVADFVGQFGDELRYCLDWDHWIYLDRHWRIGQIGVDRMILLTFKSIYERARAIDDKDFHANIAWSRFRPHSEAWRDRILRLAAHHPALMVDPEGAKRLLGSRYIAAAREFGTYPFLYAEEMSMAM